MEARRIKDYIHEAVTEGIQSASGIRAAGTKYGGTSTAEQRRDASPVLEVSSRNSSDFEESSDYLFDFQCIESYVAAVKEAIDWEQDVQPPEKIKRFFPSRKKQRETFPLLPGPRVV